MPLGTFTPIGSYIIDNNTTAIYTINNIPQNYTDLFLSVSGAGLTGGGSINTRCNGDSGSNYTYSFFWSNDSSTNTGNGTGTAGQVARIIQQPSSEDGGGYAIFFNYANPIYYKYWLNTTAHYNITLNGISSWRTTAPITSLSFFIESGSLFYTGFKFDLYGILRA